MSTNIPVTQPSSSAKTAPLIEVIIFVVLLAIALRTLFFYPERQTPTQKLIAGMSIVTAVVTAVEEGQTTSVRYAYVLDSANYQGIANVDPSIGLQLKPGSHILIAYEPRHPQKSIYMPEGAPIDDGRSRNLLILAAYFTIFLLVAGAVRSFFRGIRFGWLGILVPKEAFHDSRPPRRRQISALLSGITAICVTLYGISQASVGQHLSNGDQVQAVIKSIRWDREKDEAGQRDLEYDYIVKGRVYHGEMKLTGSSTSDLKEGQQLSIYVDPERPSTSSTEPDNGIFVGGLKVFSGLALLLQLTTFPGWSVSVIKRSKTS